MNFLAKTRLTEWPWTNCMLKPRVFFIKWCHSIKKLILCHKYFCISPPNQYFFVHHDFRIEQNKISALCLIISSIGSFVHVIYSAGPAEEWMACTNKLTLVVMVRERLNLVCLAEIIMSTMVLAWWRYQNILWCRTKFLRDGCHLTEFNNEVTIPLQ